MCGKMVKNVVKVLFLLGILCITGCGKKQDVEDDLCHIVVEAGEGYLVKDAVRVAESGSDVSFSIMLEDGWQFLGSDFRGETETVRESDGKTVQLTLKDVKYSETICVRAEKGQYEITYDANGGQPLSGRSDVIKVGYRGTHQRINTSVGTDLFERDGYTLIGWNTRADGSGLAVGLGSRIEWSEGITLYAQWTSWTDEDCFSYREDAGFAVITGYVGKNEEICVPASLGGLPVRTIAEKAFYRVGCRTVILPYGIYEIEKWAFQDSSLEKLYIYDDLIKVSDYAFEGCAEFRTLQINAIEAPAYSGNYFDTFQDKYDRMLSLKDKKKIVLFSGSSTRFGYDSALIDEAFPEYEVVNMGVFAYSPALPQLELIRSCMKEGDILVDSPEFDAANRQFCHQKNLDYAVFAMMESNYDAFALLDLREYTQVFTAFSAYQAARRDMERKSYEVCAADYDEDGNAVSEPSYNLYGDYVLYRPNAEKEEPVYGLAVNYTVNAFPKETYIASINAEFQKFLDSGVKVYFTYSPRNKFALSEDSTEEERARLHGYLQEELIVPVISALEDSLYSGTYLYGTDNHLSTEGVKIRTEKVIRDLKAQLEKEEEK